jgi:putative multiple sugar transport system permease protein
LGVLNNGMSILGVDVAYQQVIKGVVLLGAVALDIYASGDRAVDSCGCRTPR